MKAIINSLIAIQLCVIGSAQVTADTIFDGNFSNWAPDGPNPMVRGTGTDTLIWGDPGNFGVGPSVVSYNEYNISTDLVLSGQPFDVGRIEYFNGTILGGTGISSALLFLRPFSDDDILDTSNGFLLRLITESTPNIGTPRENADYLFFQSSVHDPFVPAFFNVHEGGQASADVVARLDFISDLSRHNPAVANTQGRYELNILGFENLEGDGFLTFTPVSSIPEPSSIVLLFSTGLSALVILRRRAVKRRRLNQNTKKTAVS